LWALLKIGSGIEPGSRPTQANQKKEGFGTQLTPVGQASFSPNPGTFFSWINNRQKSASTDGGIPHCLGGPRIFPYLEHYAGESPCLRLIQGS
jgi:hypothetical protein